MQRIHYSYLWQDNEMQTLAVHTHSAQHAGVLCQVWNVIISGKNELLRY